MAGGIGSRFWPLSRESRPKQFLDLLGIGKSMLQMTFERFEDIVGSDHIYIVTSDQYEDDILDQLPKLNKDQIISEPARKNTAPCILYAAKKLHQLAENSTMIVSPADHFILEQDIFKDTIDHSVSFLETNDDVLLTLGIQPTKPHTGYGYIQFEETSRRVKRVKTFTEKPSKEFAESFLASGDFLWNSGIFLWKTNAILKAFEEFLPELHSLFEDLDYNSTEEREQIEGAYSLCQNISIDYGILEKHKNVYTVPSYFTWSDLGTWESLYAHRAEGDGANVTNSSLIFPRNVNSSMVHVANKDKLVILQDVEELIVVDTDDALVICHKNSEQKIKEIVRSLQNQDLPEYL